MPRRFLAADQRKRLPEPAGGNSLSADRNGRNVARRYCEAKCGWRRPREEQTARDARELADRAGPFGYGVELLRTPEGER